MAQRIQLRRGTAAQWSSANPTLEAAEVGVETDTLRFKIGNGVATWGALDYQGGGGEGGEPGRRGSLWSSGGDPPGGGLLLDGDHFLRTSGPNIGEVLERQGANWTVTGNIRGAPGQTGQTGPPGGDGAPGPPGAGITFKGKVADRNALPGGASVGDAYITEADPGLMFVWNGAAWDEMTLAAGPPGDPGDPGETGERGSVWTVGTTPPLDPLELDLHLSTAEPGEVLQASGGAWTAVANIRGPQGSDGARGNDGAPGVPGIPGSDGAPGVPGRDGRDAEWEVMTQADFDQLVMPDENTLYLIVG